MFSVNNLNKDKLNLYRRSVPGGPIPMPTLSWIQLLITQHMIQHNAYEAVLNRPPRDIRWYLNP